MGMGERLGAPRYALASACVSQPDVILRRVLEGFPTETRPRAPRTPLGPPLDLSIAPSPRFSARRRRRHAQATMYTSR